MNNRKTRRYDTFVCVQTFGKDKATDFAASSKREKKSAGGATPPKPNP